MPTFIGFSTVGRDRKFTLTDSDLVKQDLVNALNINQGELPGRPQIGSRIWSYVFENQTTDTLRDILAEVQRVAGQDPRIYIVNSDAFPQDNGILIELLIQIRPFTEDQLLQIFLDQQTRRATFI